MVTSNDVTAEVPNQPAAFLLEFGLVFITLHGIRADGVANKPVLLSSVRSCVQKSK